MSEENKTMEELYPEAVRSPLDKEPEGNRYNISLSDAANLVATGGHIIHQENLGFGDGEQYWLVNFYQGIPTRLGELNSQDAENIIETMGLSKAPYRQGLNWEKK